MNGIEPLAKKWDAFGWHVITVEKGDDPCAVKAAVQDAKTLSGRPVMILLKTTKGCGIPSVVALGAANHNMNFSAEDAAKAVAEMKGGAV